MLPQPEHLQYCCGWPCSEPGASPWGTGCPPPSAQILQKIRLMTFCDMKLLLTLWIVCSPVEMYLCKLVAVRQPSAWDKWSLCISRERMRGIISNWSVFLRCGLGGELGGVAIVSEDCLRWLELIVPEVYGREHSGSQTCGDEVLMRCYKLKSHRCWGCSEGFG